MEKLHDHPMEETGHAWKSSIEVLGGACTLFVLHLTSRYSYTLFHSLSEGFSICISIAIFLFAWNSRRFMDNNYFLFLGIASLFIGFIDGIHTLAYKGMGVFDGYGANLSTQLWILARYMHGISFLVAPVFLRRSFRVSIVLSAYACVTAFSLLSIFSWGIFPVCYVDGAGLTTFKVVSEHVISLIFLASLGMILVYRQLFDAGVLRLIGASILFNIFSELAFTHYLGVYDFLNQVGHLFKIVAYYLLYRAVIFIGLRKPYTLLFRTLRQSREALEESNLMLGQRVTEQVREISLRMQAEHELQSHRDRLEELVNERTVELEEKNRRLAEEIAVRVEAEGRLKKSMAEIEDLYHNAPCGYHSLDEDGVYLRINDTELKWLGYAREEVVGKLGFQDVLAPASRQTFRENFSRLRRHGWTSDLECEMIRKDGTVMPVFLSSTAMLDGSGTFVRSRATLFDITERRRAEEERARLENQLFQAQKMEALGRFAGGIAHDLNNILYPIIIDTEMLVEESRTNGGMHEALEKILMAAYRQRDLVKQILSFSRRSDQQLKPMKVGPLITETLNLIRSTIPKTIEIRQHLHAGRDTILGDPTQIQQVIMNLCRNAADSIVSPTGTIEVSLENETREPDPGLPGEKGGEYLLLTVKDTGCGIPPETMDRIFEPFFTTKEVEKGNGMGLAVVHGILKSHHGDIAVRSSPERGTVFSVSLPVTHEDIPGEGAPAAHEIPARGKGRILLVDDEGTILTSIQNALKRLGYEVIAVEDPLEARDLFRASPLEYDLVMTDLTMPQMNGGELAGEILDLRPDMPVILCTGYSDVMDEQEAKALGIRELIMKPAGIGELKAAIGRALGGFGDALPGKSRG